MPTVFILWIVIALPMCGCGSQQPDPNPKSKSVNHTDKSGNENSNNSSTAKSNEAVELKAQWTQVIPETLVEFEMILVPGDEAKGIKPFYLGAREVTWDEFGYWALCEDISEKKAILEREKKLRPSAPHDTEQIYRGWGRASQPAIGMSRLSAELYCQWLSQQTGRKYRLPTKAEWDHAFETGGMKVDQVPDAEAAAKIAWFLDNTLDEETFDNRAMKVGTRLPNSLGIFDMLGNVSEWVTGTGEQKLALGGNFLTPADQLTGNKTEIEDQRVWNRNYPNDPKSIWWYVDTDFVGFRLVCDP